jgi:hypothetical protein
MLSLCGGPRYHDREGLKVWIWARRHGKAGTYGGTFSLRRAQDDLQDVV